MSQFDWSKIALILIDVLWAGLAGYGIFAWMMTGEAGFWTALSMGMILARLSRIGWKRE